ncbi:MAG: hypothetical protein ACTHK2_07425, partial [Dokdonella sp.]
SAAGVVLAAGIAWHVGQDALRREAQGELPVQSTPAAPQRSQNYVPVQPLSEPAAKRVQPSAQEPVGGAAPATAPPAPPAAAKPMPRKTEARAKEQSPARVTQPAPPPPPAAAAAAPDAFPAEAQREEAETASAPVAADAAGAVAKERSGGKAARARGVSTPPTSSFELRRDMQLAPDDWLAHIRQLLHQGRRQQATDSLRLFHAAHPERPLPDELRALLD